MVDNDICDGVPDTPEADDAIDYLIDLVAKVELPQGVEPNPWIDRPVTGLNIGRWRGLMADACINENNLGFGDMNHILDEIITQLRNRRATQSNSIVAVAQWEFTAAAIQGLPAGAKYRVQQSGNTCDHSKLAWTTTNNWICAGDLNRQGGKSIFTGNMWR
jgi:hypothetical protein